MQFTGILLAKNVKQLFGLQCLYITGWGRSVPS